MSRHRRRAARSRIQRHMQDRARRRQDRRDAAARRMMRQVRA